MKSSDAPSKQSVPFGVNGSRQSILDTTPTGSNAASYDVGFPPITMILKSAGGLPPLGQNLNEVLYELSGISRFLSAGGGYVYDSTFSTAVSGYPAGAVIPNSTLNGLWINTIDDNTTNPENSTAALTGWVPAFSYGATSLTGLTSASVTVGTLDASKDVISLSGLLTANINLVLPAWIKKWDIINNTTGSFTVTVKTPSGNGVAISSGSKVPVIGDGTNINTNYAPGTLIGLKYFTTQGISSYTPTPGTKKAKIIVTGGGGGGGGSAGTSTSNTISGAGGGAGGTTIAYASIDQSITYTVSVGAGGSGGAASAGGGSGSQSSLYNGSNIIASASGGFGAAWTSAATTAGGDGGGGSSSQGLAIRGGYGSDGQSGSTFIFAGNGGDSYWGGGGRAGAASGGAGRAYGSGGGGAYGATGATYTGGAGASGVVYIEEYA